MYLGHHFPRRNPPHFGDWDLESIFNPISLCHVWFVASPYSHTNYAIRATFTLYLPLTIPWIWVRERATSCHWSPQKSSNHHQQAVSSTQQIAPIRKMYRIHTTFWSTIWKWNHIKVIVIRVVTGKSLLPEVNTLLSKWTHPRFFFWECILPV